MRTTMVRKILLAGGVALTALGSLSPAEAAQNYNRDNWFWNFPNERWCLSEENSMATDCGFKTFAQCNYSRNGTGGTCSPNPRYVEESAPRKRKKASR